MTESIKGLVKDIKQEEGNFFLKLDKGLVWDLIEKGIISQIEYPSLLKGEFIEYFVSEKKGSEYIIYGLIIGKEKSSKKYQYTKIKRV